MPDLISHRPGLTPAGDAAIDQAWIARGADLRSQAQPLHHAGAEALDQSVGALDQGQDPVAVLARFQIDRHGGPAAMQDRAADLLEYGGGGAAAASQAQDLGPHVGQHHAGEGDGPQAVDLDDAQSRKRSHAVRLDRNPG
ncbi:hypothetical protein D3C80_1193880 [compost metagenome]